LVVVVVRLDVDAALAADAAAVAEVVGVVDFDDDVVPWSSSRRPPRSSCRWRLRRSSSVH
jgi:hypothetical protein